MGRQTKVTVGPCSSTGGVGRLVRLGQQLVDLKLQSFWNAAKPEGGAEWSIQFQVKFLFLTSTR